MEPRNYAADAAASPPAAPAIPSHGYPTDGNPGGQPATWPGAHWIYKTGESLRRIIVAAGFTPSDSNLNLLLESIQKIATAYSLPIGSLLVIDGDVVPAGFLKRNGAELSRASYPELWAYAQSIANFTTQATIDGNPEAYAGYYGDGNGSTTFTLPDWRGEFWRAWDDGRGVDPGRGIGSWKTDSFRSHRHDIDTMQGSGTPNSVSDNIAASQNTTTSTGHQSGFTGGTETAPRSIACMALVKAF